MRMTMPEGRRRPRNGKAHNGNTGYGHVSFLMLQLVCFAALSLFYQGRITSTFSQQPSSSRGLRNAADVDTELEWVDTQLKGITSYTSSLASLSCLTTPGCFPSTECLEGKPKKLKRRKKWEEQSFCVKDLPKQDCLVYSFGIHTSTEWEEKIASEFNCEVHAFDPTMNHRPILAPGVIFHKLGLQADGTNMSSTHAAEYNEIDPRRLLPLHGIQKRLGHLNRSISVLMLDCEGCEWGALHALACARDTTSSIQPNIEQLMVEFHFQKNLGLETAGDVKMAAQAVQCLWSNRWHIVSTELSGAGRPNWEYAPGVAQVVRSAGMLQYAAFRRISEVNQSPAELLERFAEASRNRANLEDSLNERYGSIKSPDRSWPHEEELKHKAALDLEQRMFLQYTGSARKRVQFDDNHVY